MTVELRFDGPEEGPLFAFAHGAGAGMDSSFMLVMTAALTDQGIRVVRFEFPYMAARRDGKRTGAPDRQPVLEATWREVIAASKRDLVIGGKSLGGRIATHVAAESRVRGVVCFGYPFHPPGKPATLRTAHLRTIEKPVLILQGTRDPFGTSEEVPSYALAPSIRVEWLPDGDHSLKPRVRSGQTVMSNLERAADLAAAFIGQHL